MRCAQVCDAFVRFDVTDVERNNEHSVSSRSCSLYKCILYDKVSILAFLNKLSSNVFHNLLTR